MASTVTILVTMNAAHEQLRSLRMKKEAVIAQIARAAYICPPASDEKVVQVDHNEGTK